MWYIYRNNEQYGPYSDEDISGFAQTGEILPDDYVWKESLTDWTRAADVPEFGGLFNTGIQPETTVESAKDIISSYESSKTTNEAGISDDKSIAPSKNSDSLPDDSNVVSQPLWYKIIIKPYTWIAVIIIFFTYTFYLERYILPPSIQTKRAAKIYEMIGYHGKGFGLLSNQTDDYVDILKKDFESYEKIYTYYPKSIYAAECGHKLALMQLEKGRTKTAYSLLNKIYEKYSPQTFAIESAIIMGNILCGLSNNSYVSCGEIRSFEKTQYCREGAEAVVKDTKKGIELFRDIAVKYGEKYRTYKIDDTKMEDVLSSMEERKAFKDKEVEIADKNFKTIALRCIALYYLSIEEYSKAADVYDEFVEENKNDQALIIEYAQLLGYKLKNIDKAEKWLKILKNNGYDIEYMIEGMKRMEKGIPVY